MSRITALFPCLLLLLSSDISAESLDNSPVVSSRSGRALLLQGEYEKGLEQLRRAHELFPLNANVKHDLADGYAAYGHRFIKQKRFDLADEYFVKAMELFPEEAAYSLLRGICNYNLKKYDLARDELTRFRNLKEDSAEALYYLGLVEYETENRALAIELWEKALVISSGRREIAELLTKARKETAVESGMDRGHSSRFDLSYDPGVDPSLALSILEVLEAVANQAGAELAVFPEARVSVVIYKRDDFKNVTDSPDWAGGYYDGKIRLPFGSLQEITPSIRGVLYHEYVHILVSELTRGNCPHWLNEGVAEMFGRKQHNRPMTELRRAVRNGTLFNFKKLETGFGALSSSEVALAYQQSYSLVNYIITRYGWHRLRQILTGLGTGMSLDDTITDSLRDYNLNFDLLVQEWHESVQLEMSDGG